MESIRDVEMGPKQAGSVYTMPRVSHVYFRLMRNPRPRVPMDTVTQAFCATLQHSLHQEGQNYKLMI